MDNYKSKIESLGACHEGKQWIFATDSPVEAWLTCVRTYWMSWLIEGINYENMAAALEIAKASEMIRAKTLKRSVEYVAEAEEAQRIFISMPPGAGRYEQLKTLAIQRISCDRVILFPCANYCYLLRVNSLVERPNILSLVLKMLCEWFIGWNSRISTILPLVKSIIPFTEIEAAVNRRTERLGCCVGN